MIFTGWKREYWSSHAMQRPGTLKTCAGAFGASLGVILPRSRALRGILKFIHESARNSDAYVINLAGLTEGGVATKRALTETGKPYVEVDFATSSHSPLLHAACQWAVAFNVQPERDEYCGRLSRWLWHWTIRTFLG
jgi:hypothetical protein